MRDLWEECGCIPLTDWKVAGNMCDLVASWKGKDAKMKQRGVLLAWCIWSERNKWVFEGKATPNAILVDRVRRLVEEQGKYAAKIYKTIGEK